MTRGSNIFIRNSAFIFLSAILLFSSSIIVLGQTQTGTWKAKVSKKSNQKLNISFYKEKNTSSENRKRYSISGSNFKISDLQGLTENQINGSNIPVNFSIVREAGTIQFSGTFNQGKGEGNYTFTADSNFISAMAGLGFNNISDEKLFSSAVLNVKTATVSDLRASGLQNIDLDDVFKATIFKIDSNYITEMNSAGFSNLDMDDLVKGRIFKIDANYAREVLAMGFGKQDLEELVKFRIFKVTPQFLSEMKSEGYAKLDAEQVVKLRIFKIDAKFIQKAREKGYANPSVEELVELKIFGKVK